MKRTPALTGTLLCVLGLAGLTGVLPATAFANDAVAPLTSDPSPVPAPPSPSFLPGPGPVLTPADAAARVIAVDPRFAGVMPLVPGSIGQSAWYEASITGPGLFDVSITLGFGDCPAGCIGHHTWAFQVHADGAIRIVAETGDALPPDFVPPSLIGDGVIVVQLVAGPVCPVETIPPDPACDPAPVSGATIVVRDSQGHEIQRLLSDPDGRVVIALPAGAYVLEPQPAAGLFGAPEPVAISVAASSQVDFTFAYETGIR